MDLTTLVAVAGLFLSVVVGNAAVFGDSLFASISVPKTVETAGLDRATAERLFAAHIAWYTRLPSILPTPTVSTSASPNFAMALAKPIQMQDVVHAVQSQLRNDVVSATGAIMEEPGSKQLSMLMVINNPPDAPTTLSVQQADGDAKALIALAAREAMIIIAPYRVALCDLASILTGDKNGITRARETATRGLSQPWEASEQSATEVVLLHNLLAVLALEGNSPQDATHHILQAHTTPGASRSAYALVLLNEAFLALTQRRTEDAAHFFQKGEALLGHSTRQILSGRLLVLKALIVWQEGNLKRAEELLIEALGDANTEVEPHYYLARMFKARGDEAGVAEQTTLARMAARFDQHYASLAHTILGLDVETGAVDVRAFLPETLQVTTAVPPIPGATVSPTPAAVR